MLKKPENGTQSISRWKGPGVKRWRFLRSRGRLECAKFHSFVWVSGWSLLCSPLPLFSQHFLQFSNIFSRPLPLNSKPCKKLSLRWSELPKNETLFNEKVWKVPWGKKQTENQSNSNVTQLQNTLLPVKAPRRIEEGYHRTKISI